jgi:hypothetical protein
MISICARPLDPEFLAFFSDPSQRWSNFDVSVSLSFNEHHYFWPHYSLYLAICQCLSRQKKLARQSPVLRSRRLSAARCSGLSAPRSLRRASRLTGPRTHAPLSDHAGVLDLEALASKAVSILPGTDIVGSEKLSAWCLSLSSRPSNPPRSTTSKKSRCPSRKGCACFCQHAHLHLFFERLQEIVHVH